MVLFGRSGASKRWLAIIHALFVVLAAGLLAGSAAFAHASLIETAPADGAVIEVAPETFRLRFNEPVSPLVLALVQPDGADPALDDVVLDGTTLVIAAPALLLEGSYVLNWRVMSGDGHPAAGSVVFSLGAPGGMGATNAAPAVDWPLRSAIWAMKLVLYIGLFVGVGGVFFSRWSGGGAGRAGALMAASLIAGLVAAVLSLGLQGLDMLGLPLTGLFRRSAWDIAFSSSHGNTVGLASIALLCAMVALRNDAGRGRMLAAIGFVGSGLALMASGHVSTASPHWLTRPAVFLHVMMVAFWIGALLPLLGAYMMRQPAAGDVLARFSRLIPWALLLLIATGMIMARIQLGGLQALPGSAYGRVLLVKLGLVALLLLVAARNRFWLTSAVKRGDALAIRRFQRSVMVELALAILIFSTVALWRFTPPPRAIDTAIAAQASAELPAILHMQSGDRMVMLHVEPGQSGSVAAEISLYDMDANPLPVQEVTLIMANPAAGIEAIRRRVTQADEFDTWHIAGLILPVPGQWQVRVEALISDFDLLTTEGSISIAP